MKKKDIAVGMFVQLKNNAQLVILETPTKRSNGVEKVLVNSLYCIRLDSYNSNLQYMGKDGNQFDIVKIMIPKTHDTLQLMVDNSKIIWRKK